MEEQIKQLQVVINNLNRRVSELEVDSHPPIGLCEFDGFKEVIERIDRLEHKVLPRFKEQDGEV